MADIEEKNKNSGAETPCAPEVMAVPVKNAEKSRGEKWFNTLTYSVLNYWVNLISSLFIADYFINLGGKKHLGKMAEWTAKGMASAKMMPLEKATHVSKTMWETLSLTSGGVILLAPLKYLEDHKRPVVHWLNKKLGVDQTAPDGHEMTPDEIHIEEELKPRSWWNVIGRRLLGMGAVVASGQIINASFRDRTKPMPHPGDPDPHGGKSQVTDTVMGLANRAFTSGYVPGGKWLATNERAQAIMGFGVLDTIFTKITASIMWMTNGGKKEKMLKEIEQVAILDPVVETAVENTGGGTRKVAPPAATHAERLMSQPQPTLQVGV